MAPSGEKSGAAEEATIAGAEKRPISTIVIVIAMQTEALPLINKFQLTEDLDSVFPKEVPWVRYHGMYKDLHINIVGPGKDSILDEISVKSTRDAYNILSFSKLKPLKPHLVSLCVGWVDNVGTVPSSLVTYASIQAFRPDLIINAGTAGGFKGKGACVGDVFLVSHAAFHDRRIPIPVFDIYGTGCRQSCTTPTLCKKLNLKVGKLSTGDSLDMSQHDETAITANDATLKDMEGAAVAYVADLFKVPAIFLKAVTDIVDGDRPTSEEYMENLAAVVTALGEKVSEVIDFINGKSLSEL